MSPKKKPDIALKKVKLLLKGFEELLMGQRAINGHLYVTNDKIMEAVRALDERTRSLVGAETRGAKSVKATLAEAERRLDKVGGKVPPGCDKGGG